jgi:CHAT domain-containing protein
MATQSFRSNKQELGTSALCTRIRWTWTSVSLAILISLFMPFSVHAFQEPIVDPAMQAQADKVNQEAIELAEKGERRAAVERFTQARNLYQRARDRKGEARSLRNIARIHFAIAKENKDQSLGYLRESLSLDRSINNHEGEGLSLAEIGQVLYKTGDSKGALKAFSEAQSLLPQSWMRDNEGLLRNMMADCYYDNGDTQKAIETYKLALDFWKTNDVNQAAFITEQLGLIYLLIDDRTNAADYLNMAQKIWHDLKKAPREAGVLKSLAILKERVGDYPGAITYYNQALSLLHDSNNKPQEAELLNLMGFFYSSLGDLERALQSHRQAMEIFRQTDDRKAEAWAHLRVALVYHLMGNPSSELEPLQAARDLFKTLNDYEGMASVLFYLGLVAETTGDYPQALGLYYQSLPYSRASHDVVNEIRTLGEIGQIYTRLRDKENALKNVAEEIALSKVLADPQIKAPLLARIAINYVLLAQDNDAINFYKQALDLYRAMDDKAGAAEILAGIGAAQEFSGDLAQALKTYEESISLREAIRTAARVEELQTGIAGKSASTYQYAARLAMQLDQPVKAFDLSERARARSLLDQLGNIRIDPRKGADSQLVAQEQALIAELNILQRQVMRSQSPNQKSATKELRDEVLRAQRQINSLQTRYAALLIQLKATNSEYVSLRTIDPFPLRDIQGLLDKDTTLVSYFITMDRTQAFIISRDSFQAVSLKVSEQDLRVAITAFRGFSNTGITDLQNLKKLHEWLVKPLKPFLKTPVVRIIPHGVLHYLPFAALSDGQRFFSDEYQLSYLPSASILSFIQRKRKPDSSTLLSLSQSHVGGLPFLTYADQMATEVAKLYHTKAVSGSSATETELRRRAGENGIVFLAAHGRLNSISPLFSNIVLAPDNENDGLLEVHEVYGLDLKKTDLVVLSSCQTQLGKQSLGDDIVGLNRAFIYAGTPSVIASLWSVEEQSTSELMIDFFKNLKRGMSKTAALQAAQKQARTKNPNPYYWASFVLTGDPK